MKMITLVKCNKESLLTRVVTLVLLAGIIFVLANNVGLTIELLYQGKFMNHAVFIIAAYINLCIAYEAVDRIRKQGVLCAKWYWVAIYFASSAVIAYLTLPILR